jgi:formylglycine-generating enzyme required for sulfatase activity
MSGNAKFTWFLLSSILIGLFVVTPTVSSSPGDFEVPQSSALADRSIVVSHKEDIVQRRTALVIGNANYKSSPLRNTVNDAQDIASTLRNLGFRVIFGTDLTSLEIDRSVRKFGTELKNGGVGLFYYAGHGMQVQGRNYIIPIDADIQSEHEVRFKGVDIGVVLGEMDTAKNGMNMVFLDACRDNPFARGFRSAQKGLAQMDAPSGTLIVYATSPGSVASDGDNRNGIFTKNLLVHINTRGLEVGQMLRRVRANVRKETNGKQIPWESSSMEGEFYFSSFEGEQDFPLVETPLQPIVPIKENSILEKIILEEEQRKRAEERKRIASEERIKKLDQYYAKLIGIDRKPEESISSDLKAKAWNEFLEKYKKNNPHLGKALKRKKYWEKLARLSPEERKLSPSVNMVRLPKGCFMMGANTNGFNENERPIHEVCLNSFYLDIYEVTQEEYETVTGKNPSFFKGKYHPVEQVKWKDASTYCKTIKKRLPTEAEWEYAAQSKASYRYPWGDIIGNNNANCMRCGSQWDNTKTAPVGSFEPNSLGIFDIAGNVWEWTSDWYAADYYKTSPKENPKGPHDGKEKVLRGGSWASMPHTLRITNRLRSYPDNQRNYRGFRCAK